MSNYKNPLSRFFGFAICALALVASSNGQTAPVYTPAETFDQATPAPTAAVQPADGKIGDVQGNSAVICANIPGVTSIPSGLTKDSAGNCVATTSATGGKTKSEPRDLTMLWWGLGALALISLLVWLFLAKPWRRGDDEEENGHNHDHDPRHTPSTTTVHHHVPEPAEMPNFGAPDEPAPAVHVQASPATATATATATAPKTTPPMPHLPGTTALIIGGLLLLGALGAVPAQAGMSGLCDNANVMSFAPAAGYRGQSSVSVVDGSFGNVTGVKFAGSGVSASLSSVTANQLVINWTVAPNASLAPKQIALSCSDSSAKVFALYFRVAENLQQLQAAEMAWGMIPASVQKSMNAPPTHPQVINRTVYQTDPGTKREVAALRNEWNQFRSQYSQASAAPQQFQQQVNQPAPPVNSNPASPPPVFNAGQSAAPAPSPVASAPPATVGGNELQQALGQIRSEISGVNNRLGGLVTQVGNLQTNVTDLQKGQDMFAKVLGVLGGQVIADGKNNHDRCKRLEDFLAAGGQVTNPASAGCKTK